MAGEINFSEDMKNQFISTLCYLLQISNNHVFILIFDVFLKMSVRRTIENSTNNFEVLMIW